MLNDYFEFRLGDRVDLVEKFCYLGDMIEAGGGVKVATRARVRCAWAKFRELSPILTARDASQKVRGKVYRVCVQSVMVYFSETWAVKVEDEKKLVRSERMMVRWMCVVKLGDRIASIELCIRLGIEVVIVVMRRGRLRWFGHMKHTSVNDWVSACRSMVVEGEGLK